MENIILPNEVVIRIIDNRNNLIEIENILVFVHIFARHKNDFYLGPYFSNKTGIIRILKIELLAEVQATYDSGLMDYSSVESAFPKIEIKPYTNKEIENMRNSRINVWTNLLKGEKERWADISDLIKLLDSSQNNCIKDFYKISDDWNKENGKYEYELKMII